MLVRLFFISILAIAWCDLSKKFLVEYNALAKKMYKSGESYMLFSKVNAEEEKTLAYLYEIKGLPTLIITE